VTDPAAKAAQVYRGVSPLCASYVAAKLRIDPISREIDALVPRVGRIVDLGCGVGQVSILLAEMSSERTVIGLDSNWQRVASARQAAAAAGLAGTDAAPGRVRFLVSDVRAAPLARAACVLAIDVLHSLPLPDQDALIRRAALALEPGGRLIVREVDRAARPRWRYALVALEEHLAKAVGWGRGPGLWFRPAAELHDCMQACGLDVQVRPMWGRTPFANVLLSGTRR
jgi:SAM-dependent methyltransferase